jgi:plastocyanin
MSVELLIEELPMKVPGDTIVWVNKDLVPHTATSKVGGDVLNSCPSKAGI